MFAHTRQVITSHRPTDSTPVQIGRASVEQYGNEIRIAMFRVIIANSFYTLIVSEETQHKHLHKLDNQDADI